MNPSHRLKFALALRGTLAALTALGVAEFLGIENPYWAAMTALIVIQPTRGLLFEKSFYRLVGTVFGSLAALLLLQYTKSPFLLTCALVFWIAGCVGIGNLFHGLRSYAFLMAGCTCAVIVMSGFMNPSRVPEIAFGRIACIVVGIIVTTAVTALFTPRSPREELKRRLREVICDAIRWLSELIRDGRSDNVARLEQVMLIELADLELLLDTAGAASPGFKKRHRHVKSLIAALLSLLSVGRLAAEHLDRHSDGVGRDAKWREMMSRHLLHVASTFASSPRGGICSELAALACEARSHLPLLGETFAGLVVAMEEVRAGFEAVAEDAAEEPRHRLIRHRDWVEAGRAAFRSGLVIAAVGFTWSATGWSKGPLMMMALSIMTTIFSNKDHPAHFVGNIFVGAAIGSASAVFCRIFLLSAVHDPSLTVAVIAPFVLLGFVAMQYQRTMIAATDATLFFIFVVQPGVAVNVAHVDLAIGAVAMVAGVGTAWLSYTVLVPINPGLRMRSILAAVSRDLVHMAQDGSPQVLGRAQERLHHRVIRLVDMAARHDPEHLRTVEGGVTALGMAACIRSLWEKLNGNDLTPSSERIIREALMTIAVLAPQPDNARELLSRAARALYAVLEEGAVMKGLMNETAGAAGDSGQVRQPRNRLLWAERQ
ncbi:FUSC family protein [Geomonas subterranea]|uniref:FUSC family protein n=1 Tax=Geomonas subterranea TaxID=2847989 RepID=A0ABX8LIR2_9BACT|nr:FUSC family protein [Geomonas subterranea]QXE91354.1 FUSC family protein [Geomonas subterranea]QXM10559.1 FUSC family protein [Geomonas subterranea]